MIIKQENRYVRGNLQQDWHLFKQLLLTLLLYYQSCSMNVVCLEWGAKWWFSCGHHYRKVSSICWILDTNIAGACRATAVLLEKSSIWHAYAGRAAFAVSETWNGGTLIYYYGSIVKKIWLVLYKEIRRRTRMVGMWWVIIQVGEQSYWVWYETNCCTEPER